VEALHEEGNCTRHVLAILVSRHLGILSERNDRDGTSFAEELDDEGSDWELMKQAARWCLGES
jgi:hypothetical protein